MAAAEAEAKAAALEKAMSASDAIALAAAAAAAEGLVDRPNRLGMRPSHLAANLQVTRSAARHTERTAQVVTHVQRPTVRAHGARPQALTRSTNKASAVVFSIRFRKAISSLKIEIRFDSAQGNTHLLAPLLLSLTARLGWAGRSAGLGWAWRRQVLQLLNAHGADLQAADARGRTPLFIACAMGRADCAHFLCDLLSHDDG